MTENPEQLELERHPDMRPGEYVVPMAELEELWDSLREQGILYNGMTHVELMKRYPDRLRHIMGFGWVVQAE